MKLSPSTIVMNLGWIALVIWGMFYHELTAHRLQDQIVLGTALICWNVLVGIIRKYSRSQLRRTALLSMGCLMPMALHDLLAFYAHIRSPFIGGPVIALSAYAFYQLTKPEEDGQKP